MNKSAMEVNASTGISSQKSGKLEQSFKIESSKRRSDEPVTKHFMEDFQDSSEMILNLLETVNDLKKSLAISLRNQKAVVHALHQSAARMYAIQVAGNQLISGDFNSGNTDKFRFSVKDPVGTPGWATSLENYIQDAANSLIALIQRLSAKKLVEAEHINSITRQMKSLTETVENELNEVIETPQFSVLDSKINDQLVKTYSKMRKEQFL